MKIKIKELEKYIKNNKIIRKDIYRGAFSSKPIDTMYEIVKRN